MVDTINHDLVGPDDRHPIHFKEYANQTARKYATGLISTDLGKIVIQSDDKSFWKIDSLGPLVYTPFSPPAPTIGNIGEILGVVTDGDGYLKFDWVAGAANLTFDDVYHNETGSHTINVNNGGIVWTHSETYSNITDLSGLTGTVSGHRIINGADYFSIIRKGVNLSDLESALQNISLNASVNLSLKDQHLTAAVNLSQSGQTALTTTNQSIIGAINEIDGIVAPLTSLSFNDIYDNESGDHLITMDDGDVIWSPSGANNFTVWLNEAGDNYGFNVIHYIPPNGSTTYFKILEDADQAKLIADLKSFDFNGREDSTIQTTLGANIDVKPSGLFNLQKSGSVTNLVDFATITNSAYSASMIDTRTGLRFDQFYQDGTPAAADAARIIVGTETNWTITDSTQDAYMAFGTALGGTVSERMRITSGGKVGIGLTTPNDWLSVKDIDGTSVATLGSEIVINGDFATDLSGWTAGANWAWSSGTALHTAGSTATIYQGVATTANEHYRVSVTMSGRTAGSVTMTLQNSTDSFTLNSNSTYIVSFKAGTTATNNLIFTPTTDFNGALDDVSFKLITPASIYGFSILDSTGMCSNLCSIAGSSALHNIFLGVDSGKLNIDGDENIFAGYQAGASNTTGSGNAYFGYQSGKNSTTGSLNAFFGYQSGYSSTTGFLNNFMGYLSGTSNTTGSYNTFLGAYSGRYNTTGYSNSFVGYNCGQNNTTGYSCSFIGPFSGYNNTTGDNNVFIGGSSGFKNTSGTRNMFLGTQAGYGNTTGHHNTCLGDLSGKAISTGADNATGTYLTLLGVDTRPLADADTNEICIGYQTYGLGSNTVNIGNSSITKTRLGGLLQLDKDLAYTSAPVSALSMGRNATAGYGWIQSYGVSASDLLNLNPLGGGLNCFAGVSEGTTPEAKIYGYRTGDLLRAFEVAVGIDAPDSVSFNGVSHFRFDGLLEPAKGRNMASANDMVAPEGNFVVVTGNTQINTVDFSNIQSGTFVTFKFDSNPIVKHATSGTGAQFQLAGSADFSPTAGSNLTVVYDGPYLREVSRTVV